MGALAKKQHGLPPAKRHRRKTVDPSQDTDTTKTPTTQEEKNPWQIAKKSNLKKRSLAEANTGNNHTSSAITNNLNAQGSSLAINNYFDPLGENNEDIRETTEDHDWSLTVQWTYERCLLRIDCADWRTA